jgi:hypothetical protein
LSESFLRHPPDLGGNFWPEQESIDSFLSVIRERRVIAAIRQVASKIRQIPLASYKFLCHTGVSGDGEVAGYFVC